VISLKALNFISVVANPHRVMCVRVTGAFIAMHRHDLSLRTTNLIHITLGSLALIQGLANASVDVTAEIFGKRDGMHFNQQMRLYRDGLAFGDLTLRVHIQNAERIEDQNVEEDDEKKQDIGPSAAAPKIVTRKTHSIILRNVSSYFKGMLAVKMKEAKDMVMDVHAEHEYDVDRMILFFLTNDGSFIDTETEDVTPGQNARRIVRLAHLYRCQNLFDCCIFKITNTLTVSNFVQTAHLIMRYENDQGIQALLSFGAQHSLELKGRDDYQTLHYMFRYTLEHHAVNDSSLVSPLRRLSGTPDILRPQPAPLMDYNNNGQRWDAYNAGLSTQLNFTY